MKKHKQKREKRNCIFCKCEFDWSPSISHKIYCSTECCKKDYKKKYNRTKNKWYCLRLRSKKIGLDYCSLEEFENFYNRERFCEYCDMPENLSIELYNHFIEVDRKDSEKGYIIDNMALCCRKCNTVKNNILSYNDMKEIGKKYIKPKWVGKLNKIEPIPLKTPSELNYTEPEDEK